MANDAGIARPYAEAIFRFAQAHNTLAQYDTLLSNIAHIAAHDEVAPLLRNPTCTKADKITLFQTLLNTTDQHMQALLSLLAKQNRLGNAPAIYDAFNTLCQKANNTSSASIFSAQKLTKAQQNAITKTLEKRTGKTIETHFHEDTTLIGGLLIKIDNQVEDYSILGMLNHMKNALIFNEEASHATT